jgi:hypothetical protein
MYTTVKCEGCGREIVVKTGVPAISVVGLVAGACTVTMGLTVLLPAFIESRGAVAGIVGGALLLCPLLLFGGLTMYAAKRACRDAEQRASDASDLSGGPPGDEP